MTVSKVTDVRRYGLAPLALPISRHEFDGGLGAPGAQGLADYLRGLAQDLARIRLETSGVVDFTDNSTGTASTTTPALTIPAAAYDGSATGASPATAFNTQAGVFMNGCAVIADNLNNACARVGLAQVHSPSGTIAAAATIPAQTKALSATSGATAIDFATGVAAMSQMRDNLSTLIWQANSLAAALGVPTISDLTGGTPLHGSVRPTTPYFTLLTPTTGTAGTGISAGKTSIADSVMDPFLGSCADIMATLASFTKEMLGVPPTTAITDNSSGTASLTVGALVAPTAAAGAATTSAPKAGVDTQLALYTDAFGELVAKVNILLKHNAMSVLTDSTGVTADSTIAAEGVTFSAVDGSSGTSALDVTSYTARIASIRNNLATLASAYNTLAPLYGELPLTDSSGGTAGATVAAIAATATGVGSASAVTVLNTAAQTYAGTIRDAVASLAARVNSLIGATVSPTPLHVVAAQ